MHASIADVIADTAQNSIEAGASRISVDLTEDGKMIRVKIQDNGKGMDPATLKRVWDPFYTEPGKHAKRRVGLGLPILKQLAESTGGAVSLASEKGKGTTLSYSFAADNVDLPPMGDLPETVTMLFNYDGAFELVWSHAKGTKSYSVARSELVDAVGSLHEAQGLKLADEFLRSQEDDLNLKV